MNIYVLNEKLEKITVLDKFESLIWTERYNTTGDFEIYTVMNQNMYSSLKEDYYLQSDDSDCLMIIEDIQINSDVEEGNKLIVTGRSLESILDRRIVWNLTIVNDNIQNVIEKLLNENIISPSDEKRKISNFIFERIDDERLSNITINSQYYGETILEIIEKICSSNNIGFRIVLTNDNKFKFSLYIGEDRSYDQLKNPYVIFSPKFDNVISSNYLESKKNYKNVALVAGEGEGSNRKTVTVIPDSSDENYTEETDLNRRELYVDARDISSSAILSDTKTTQYEDQLLQRGKEYLKESEITKSFEGETETTKIFVYGIDFFIGDVVQIANEYGMESKSRITEIVKSQSSTGINVFPTFTHLE